MSEYHLRNRYNVKSNIYGDWRSVATDKKSKRSTRSVPEWEKRFCFEVGRVPWKRLLESHKFMSSHSNIMIHWNDLAVKKAFHDAKKRYWAKINGLPSKIPLPNPDMYIDNIDWNNIAAAKFDEEADQMLSGLDVASDELQPQQQEYQKTVKVIDSNFCRILMEDMLMEDIQTTGWDVEYSQEPKSLTGMIVGGDTNYRSNPIWKRSDEESRKGKGFPMQDVDENYYNNLTQSKF